LNLISNYKRTRGNHTENFWYFQKNLGIYRKKNTFLVKILLIKNFNTYTVFFRFPDFSVNSLSLQIGERESIYKSKNYIFFITTITILKDDSNKIFFIILEIFLYFLSFFFCKILCFLCFSLNSQIFFVIPFHCKLQKYPDLDTFKITQSSYSYIFQSTVANKYLKSSKIYNKFEISQPKLDG
jgi:hypothetical protein